MPPQIYKHPWLLVRGLSFTSVAVCELCMLLWVNSTYSLVHKLDLVGTVHVFPEEVIPGRISGQKKINPFKII